MNYIEMFFLKVLDMWFLIWSWLLGSGGGKGGPPQQSDRSWEHRSPSCVNRWKNPENLAEKKVWSCGENFLWFFLVATEAATGAGVERTSPKSISCIAPFSELRWPILFSRKLTISPEWVLNGPYFFRVFWMLLTPRFNQLIKLN